MCPVPRRAMAAPYSPRGAGGGLERCEDVPGVQCHAPDPSVDLASPA
ncbi:hypothetical protein MPTK2_3g01240 [Marchantia polymorpha subsp. ruderalis]